MLSAFVLGCFCLLASSESAFGATRIAEDISAGWRFLRMDVGGAESPDYQEGSFQEPSPWQGVDLPHTWNTKDIFDDEPGYYRGVGWYRRDFVIPDAWKGKRIVIRFEAACSVATVWLNGELLGQHKGSWTPFEFDITRLVEPGSRNLVAVRVDNRWRRDVPAQDMDFNFMGGLHREVFLIATDPLHIASTRVTTPQVSDAAAVAKLATEVRNDSEQPQEYQVVVEIQGPGLSESIRLQSAAAKVQPGETVIVEQETKPIANPKLWSPDEPNLYGVSFRLLKSNNVVDDMTSPLGFRWYRFDPDQGFFLNGKHLKLQGVNRHDDYPGLGWALPKSRQVEDVKLIKQLGANFLRTVHYPQHPIVLETCDKLGLIVWEEVPFDGEGCNRASYVGADDFARTTKHNLRELIRRDRNHPCIVLWSMGNENMNGADLEDRKAVAALTRQLHEVSKEEDPTRPTAVAICSPEHAKESGQTEAVDILGYNLYQGWYEGEIEKAAAMIDAFHRANPTKPLIMSEYGGDIERGLHTDSPRRMDCSEEYGRAFHEAYWKAIAERPYIAGSLIWNVFDFGVERRGENQTIRHMNQKGIYTYDRQPKDVYYFYVSQWTREPMVYIISHTWTERKQGATPIRVYSNCDSVELFLNGKSLGVKDKADAFVWDVTLAAGDNELRAIAGRDGKQTAVDAIRVQCK